MNWRSKVSRITVVALLALVPAACSSTGTSRISLSSLCQKSGGTYAAGSCQPASNPQTASQLCASHGGVYVEGGDYCEVANSMFWKP